MDKQSCVIILIAVAVVGTLLIFPFVEGTTIIQQNAKSFCKLQIFNNNTIICDQINDTAIFRAGQGMNIYITDHNSDTIWFNATGDGVGETNTASNLGTGSSWFKQKVGVDLQFKTASAGTGISITDTGNELLFNSTGSGGISSINTDTTNDQVFSGSANRIIITDIGAGLLAWNIGSDVLVTNGTQIIAGTKNFTNTVNFFGTAKYDSDALIIRNPSSTFAYTLKGLAITANKTLNYPLLSAIADTFVTQNITMTLRDKTINDTSSYIADGNDLSKKANLDSSLISANHIQTHKLLNRNGTLQHIDKLGNHNLSINSNCLDGQIYKFQSSNSTWICGTDSGASLTRISGASGAAGADITWQTLTADATAITSTTPVVVMTTTGVGTGTWAFKYTIIYQSAATGTGLGIAVDHTGTNSDFVSTWSHTTTGATQSTGVGDQLTGTKAGQMMEGKSERTDNTVSSTSTGVDTANAHMMAVTEGIVVVTGSGDLQLKVITENAGTAITVQSGTSLELKKIA